jgi:ABC-2 type transport system permease protein
MTALARDTTLLTGRSLRSIPRVPERLLDEMQGVGFIIVFPPAFLAGTFVLIAGMDAIPRAIAQWDPIAALVATVGELTQGLHSSGSWQLDHPELAMALWCLLIIAVCVPLALRRFNGTLAS